MHSRVVGLRLEENQGHNFDFSMECLSSTNSFIVNAKLKTMNYKHMLYYTLGNIYYDILNREDAHERERQTERPLATRRLRSATHLNCRG